MISITILIIQFIQSPIAREVAQLRTLTLLSFKLSQSFHDHDFTNARCCRVVADPRTLSVRERVMGDRPSDIDDRLSPIWPVHPLRTSLTRV